MPKTQIFFIYQFRVLQYRSLLNSLFWTFLNVTGRLWTLLDVFERSRTFKKVFVHKYFLLFLFLYKKAKKKRESNKFFVFFSCFIFSSSSKLKSIIRKYKRYDYFNHAELSSSSCTWGLVFLETSFKYFNIFFENIA